jgi:flagellar biosynthesis protein FlhG
MTECEPMDRIQGAPTAAQDVTPGRHRRIDCAGRTAALVFAVTSGKGGVGKTNVVANLATALALMKKKVMAIDADLGLANLDLFLRVQPKYTLADFFSGAVPLGEVFVVNRNGILLLPGASGAQEITALSHEQKAALLTELDVVTHELDLVLVDTGSGISDVVTYFTTAAQEIVVVVTPEPASITDAYALIKVLTGQRQQRFRILANNVADEKEAWRLFDTLSSAALRFLNASLDFVGWIPRDPQLVRAVARAQTVVVDAPSSPSARAFTSLAEQFVRMAGGVKVKGNVQFFFRRMIEWGKAQ